MSADSSERVRRPVPRTLVLAALAALLVTPAEAQQVRGALRAIVVDRLTDDPVAGADVLLGDRIVGVTGASGSVSVSGVALGEARVSVRAVGYQPAEIIVNFTPGKTFEIRFIIERAPTELEAVVVEGLVLPRNRVSEVFERMRSGRGDFITRDDIEALRPVDTSTALSYSHRIKLHYVNQGECLDDAVFGPSDQRRPDRPVSASAIGEECRDMQARPTVQVLMGRGFRRCIPSLYLDGIRYTFIEGTQIDDVVHPYDIELIEVYDEFGVPGEFMNADVGCGVIVIWTRAG